MNISTSYTNIECYSKKIPGVIIQFSFNAFLFLLFIIVFAQCKGTSGLPDGDKDNGGLFLPGNFEAVVVVDSIGGARHLAVNDNGDIYVKLRNAYPDGGNVALRDEDNDGKADIIKKFWCIQIRSVMVLRCAYMMAIFITAHQAMYFVVN